jgi:hypothetical protein
VDGSAARLAKGPQPELVATGHKDVVARCGAAGRGVVRRGKGSDTFMGAREQGDGEG